MLNALRPLFLLAALAVVPAALAEDSRAQRSDVGERIRQVERDGGRELRAERVQRGGQETYRLKVLTPEGRVRVLHGTDERSRPDPGRFERRGLQVRDRMRRPPEPRTEASERREPDPGRGRRDD